MFSLIKPYSPDRNRLSRLTLASLFLITLVTLLIAGEALQAKTTRVTLRVGGSDIHVSMSGHLPQGQSTILGWVRNAAQTVSHYYGSFPVASLDVRIRGTWGSSIGGTAYGYDRHIDIPLGNQVNKRKLDNDWVLIHEMIHMGHPGLPDRQRWFKEGVATYVEPIARAQVGDQPVGKVWADMTQQIPQGLPRSGDRGLDYTPTWGRTYWGGALFCLLADIEIRERTNNRKGLQDALRGIVEAGGTLDRRWSMRRTMEIGDRAVGVPVLSELYDRMRDDPSPVDLDALWRQLGVIKQRGGVKLVDTAPLASVRKAITN